MKKCCGNSYKIYSLQYGKGCFICIFLLTILFLLYGIIFITRDIELAVMFFCCGVIFIIILLCYIRLKYLNYVFIDEKGIKNKNIEIDWDNVFITIDVASIGGGKMKTYRLFISTSYVEEKLERKKLWKSGMFIDCGTLKRFELLSKYYKKKYLIVCKNVYNEKGLDRFLKHNILELFYKHNESVEQKDNSILKQE